MKTFYARLLFVMILLLPNVPALGDDLYTDARDIMVKHADVMEGYITGLENADSAAACAATIDAYTTGMEDLIPRLKAFQEKYPALAMGTTDGQAPPEVEAQARRIEALGARMPAATMNMMKFMEDPLVQAAMERMSETMEQLGTP